ncbi:MAG: TetR/AcrR family transcriptional regulator [Bacteroidota bacterium]|nr:TetR/AcrR family transcriptional regulator [Bacteroidota bacterium]
MSASIKFSPNNKLFIRDPNETELGRKIISESLGLIDEIGFENFNFKKLSLLINSTEASLYRYFENKHKLLIYLISCYWVWLNYQIEFHTNNIKDPSEKLRIIIKLLADINTESTHFSQLNELALHRIAICEASKAYMTKEVKAEDKDGFFGEFKTLCEKITLIVRQINPDHPFPNALVTTLFEAAHHQIFFAQHMPGLTEIKVKNNDVQSVIMFLEHLAFSSLYQTSYNLKTNE